MPSTSKGVVEPDLDVIYMPKKEFSRSDLLNNVLPPTMATVTGYKNFLVSHGEIFG